MSESNFCPLPPNKNVTSLNMQVELKKFSEKLFIKSRKALC